MNVISSGNLKKESNSSGTYTIVIDDFKKKLDKSAVGEGSTTEEFHVNWSKFSIGLYIAGQNKDCKKHLSLFLYNKSDWKVRAGHEVSVKVMGGEGGVLKNSLHCIVVLRESFLSLPRAQRSSNLRI